jgi:hypothetical protein
VSRLNDSGNTLESRAQSHREFASGGLLLLYEFESYPTQLLGSKDHMNTKMILAALALSLSLAACAKKEEAPAAETPPAAEAPAAAETTPPADAAAPADAAPAGDAAAPAETPPAEAPKQ